MNMEEPVFVDLMSDIGFKKIFSRENVLKRFLNVLLAGKKTIEKLTYLDKESISQAEDKMMIFDLYCEADDGSSFIIEMQRRSEPNYISRTLFYMGQAVSDQIKKEKGWYYDLKPVYGIFFLNFHMTKRKMPKRTIRTFILKDEDNQELTELIKMFFVDLRSFKKKEEECIEPIDKFLYVFKNIKNLKTMPFVSQEQVMATIADAAAYSKLTQKERWAYDESFKHQLDWENSLYWSKREGIEEAEAKAYQKLLTTAKTLKAGGVSISLIISATGLPEDVVMNLPITEA